MRKKLLSEKKVVSAPFSFVGSARRIWKITGSSLLSKIIMFLPALALILLAWFFVLNWYILFSIFVIRTGLSAEDNGNVKESTSATWSNALKSSASWNSALGQLPVKGKNHKDQSVVLSLVRCFGPFCSPLSYWCWYY